MFTLKSIESIKKELVGHNGKIMNFPKNAVFKFDSLYKEVVVRMETAEISPECVLYGSVESYNTTKLFSDKSYWSKSTRDEEIKEYWIIGQNGQGDFWITDINNKIHFYDHDAGELSRQNFTALNIDFRQWLQFAYLNKEFDMACDKDGYTEEAGKEYRGKLKEISVELLENYPFNLA